MNKQAKVVAITSISGGGKTTLIKKVAEKLNASVLLFDDYAAVSEYPEDIKTWLDKGADLNEWKTPQFISDIMKLKRGDSVVTPLNNTIKASEIIVIEEPTGRNRIDIAGLLDFVAVIDTSVDIGLARRILRDQQYFINPEEVESYKNFINYINGYLDQYLNGLRDSYLEIHKQNKETCDLLIDGALSLDDKTKLLINALKENAII